MSDHDEAQIRKGFKSNRTPFENAIYHMHLSESIEEVMKTCQDPETLDVLSRCHQSVIEAEMDYGLIHAEEMRNSGLGFKRSTPMLRGFCIDCGKITPKIEGVCCFEYLVTDELWKEICNEDTWIQLCLRCCADRFDRPFTVNDFPEHKINKNEEYRKILVNYANSDANDAENF